MVKCYKIGKMNKKGLTNQENRYIISKLIEGDGKSPSAYCGIV